MNDLFLFLLNNSITAGYLVLAVLLLRPLLKKAPKYIRCILWSFVGLRLMLPISIESVFSLIPSAEPIPPEILYQSQPAIHTGISVFNYTVNPVISATMAPNVTTGLNPMQIIITAGGYLWIAGMLIMLLYALISFLRLRRDLREAVREQENIWLCDRVHSPFLLGFFRPRIYLPSDLPETDKPYVISHEQAHIRRKDHWWKPLGFLLLTVYWFNPLMWVAYIFLCRDIEFACDEKVIRELGSDSKKLYSEALIHCSSSRKMISACPVAFGEDGVKGRIKSVLHYKKPAFWIILIAVVLCIAVALCFLTVPLHNRELACQYETGKCLYSAVISADKETQTNTLIYDIHNINDAVYKDYGTGQTDYLGTLTKSDFTKEDLNRLLTAEGAKKLQLGSIRNTYELRNSTTGNREYVFFQKHNGKLILVSFFRDGTIMNVFRLNRTEKCLQYHNYTFRASVLEVRQNSLLVEPLDGRELEIADKIVVIFPVIDHSQTYEVGDWVQIDYDGIVQELYPPIIPNTFRIYNLQMLSSYFGPSDPQTPIAVPDYVDELFLDKNAEFDIDGDGIIELCAVSFGPTSGLFTFVVTAYENNIPEYQNIFNTEWFDYDFRKEPDGSVVLAGMTQGSEPEEVVYRISVQDGQIVLNDGTENAWYWGNVSENTLSAVRTKYPHFMNLTTDKGLEVYVWNNHNWRCGVRSGTNRNPTVQELQSFGQGATLEEMAVILGSYGISSDSISILYTYDPAFSGAYPNTPTEDQQEFIRQQLLNYTHIPIEDPAYLTLFDLKAEKELIIYGWQMAENAWQFLFCEDTSIAESIRNATATLHGLSLEDARKKLAEYDLPPEEIPLLVIQTPISSYYDPDTLQATETARSLLFS